MQAADLHPEIWGCLLGLRVRLPHAMLFVGPAGIGKRDLAMEFAKLLLCESEGRDRACGECPSCRWFDEGNHPDFRLVEPESERDADEADGKADGDGKAEKKKSTQIVIDQIRPLEDFIHVGSHRGKARVVVLQPADSMNVFAANAVLKILEEPTPSVYFIIVSSAPQRLLPTIRSRCRAFSLPIPEQTRALTWLKDAGLSNPSEALKAAGGAPGKALILRDPALLEMRNTLVRSLSGKMDPIALAGDFDKQLKALPPATVGNSGLERLIESLQQWIYDLQCLNLGEPVRYFPAQQERMSALVAHIPAAHLLGFWRRLAGYKAKSYHPLNTRLFLEDIFLDLAKTLGDAKT